MKRELISNFFPRPDSPHALAPILRIWQQALSTILRHARPRGGRGRSMRAGDTRYGREARGNRERPRAQRRANQRRRR